MLQETATAAQTQQWSFVLQQLVQWVMAGLAWIIPFAKQVFAFVLRGDDFWSLAGMSIILFLPAGVFIAGIIGTMVSLYTIPFRLGRSVTLLQSVALAWWDALRMVWFYWAGLVRSVRGSRDPGALPRHDESHSPVVRRVTRGLSVVESSRK